MNKMKNILFVFITILGGFCSCAQQQHLSTGISNNGPKAYPAAEGFGRYTIGGRGGRTYIVSNLNDKGPGSFREAAEAKEKRMIVFALSGTIHLETKLSIAGNVTIAGQTAPGDGICLADQSVMIGGNNIIVRYLRFRMGDKYQKGGMVDGNGGDDAFGGTGKRNIIIDHCSLSWSTDEVFSVYNGDSTTLSWNLIAEPLNYSYHYETGDKDYEHHGFGAIWGGRHLSAHHNLFAHCNNRNPRFNGNRQGIDEYVDYRNNVIYNWGGNNIYAGEGGHYNLVNNYFKYGPETKESVKFRICNPGRTATIPFGKWYVDGNYVDGSIENTENNWRAVDIDKNYSTPKDSIRMDIAFDNMGLPVEGAKSAYQSVLAGVGCNFPYRDTMDKRILRNVVERTGRFADVQGGYPHGTSYEETILAWPALGSKKAPLDSDQDGIPDEWEIKHKLDPHDAADAARFTLNNDYTNLEVYINSLVS